MTEDGGQKSEVRQKVIRYTLIRYTLSPGKAGYEVIRELGNSWLALGFLSCVEGKTPEN